MIDPVLSKKNSNPQKRELKDIPQIDSKQELPETDTSKGLLNRNHYFASLANGKQDPAWDWEILDRKIMKLPIILMRWSMSMPGILYLVGQGHSEIVIFCYNVFTKKFDAFEGYNLPQGHHPISCVDISQEHSLLIVGMEDGNILAYEISLDFEVTISGLTKKSYVWTSKKEFFQS